MQRTLMRCFAAVMPLVMTACGGGGDDGSSGSSLPAPTVQLTATKTDVSRGGTTVLNWSSSDTSQCTASGSWTGAKVVSGSETVTVTADTNSYTLACSGRGGSATASASVNGLNDPPVVTNAPAEETATVNQLLSVELASDLFRDPNGDSLTVAVTRTDGSPLPPWLSLNGSNLLTGTPGWGDVGPLGLRISAADGHTGQASLPFGLLVDFLRQETCQGQRIEDIGLANGPVQMGEYVPINSYGTDMWNQYPGFTACMTATHIAPNAIRAQWKWQIPLGPQSNDTRFPFGYSSVVFGSAMTPWQSHETTTKLPVAASQFPKLRLNFDLDLDYDDQAQMNTLIDVFFAPSMSELHKITELMILTATVRVPANHDGEPLFKVEDIDYWSPPFGTRQPHPWYPEQSDSSFTVGQFTSTVPFTTGSVPIKPFIDRMISEGWIKPTDLVLSVQFGVEPNAGSATATLHSFSITVDP